MAEKKDVSKQTIVVLVFLAILVTLLGTLTVMSEISKVGVPGRQIDTSNSQTQGTVKLTIAGSEKAIDAATGQVTLEIRQPNT